jgi:hypothetical protein
MNLFRAAGMVVWAVRSAAACALRVRIWVPFLVIAGIQVLALVIMMNFHRGLLTPLVVPLIKALSGGPGVTHYPNFYLLLPVVFSRLSLLLSVLVTCIMVGAAIVLFAQAFGRAEHLKAWKTARKHYLALFIATAILAAGLFAVPYLGRLVPQHTLLQNSMVRWGVRGVLLLLSILVQSLLVYAAAWILLRREHALRAVADSMKLTRSTFVPTFVLVALPAVLLYPLGFLTSQTDLFVSKFRPEALAGIILVQIVLELLLGFLLVGAITRIFIYQTEEAA